MKRQYIKGLALVSAALWMLSSCSTDSISEYERTQSVFLTQLGGLISEMQWWRTAVTLNVDVSTEAPAQLWLMSDEDKGSLYDYKEIAESGTVHLVAPQGKGTTVYLVSVSNRQKSILPITLSGKSEEEVTLKIEPRDENGSDLRTLSIGKEKASTIVDNKTSATSKTSLYGSSIVGGATYNELSEAQKNEALLLLERAYKEYVPAKTLGANCDYELESKGDFNITWFAGNCQSYTPHVLGYYYHSPGTYDDIKYVDLSETEVYDYIDGLAKVQYKVNDEAATQYGVVADHWYDANFDMGDSFEKQSPYISARSDDDAYNTMSVFERYGRNITHLRGISFTINVPEGKCVGFYDRVENVPQPEQYDRFVKMGIKPYTTRDKFKAMNFSCEAMNMNINGSYRSCVFKTDNAIWLGMENDYTGGDLDCNDVMFEVSADLEIHRPTIVEPDLKPFGEYDEVMPWTIAYEDVARNADFDFNDAVIKLVPNYEKEECCVTVMAAGSTSKMYLHYDGPDGDINLGEIHELLGADVNTKVNTTTSVAQTPFVQVGCVKWPKGYTMEQDAHRFYIEIQRGTCADCSDVITLAEKPGQTPEALLIAGEWKWPKEGVNIMDAYSQFADWSKDITKLSYWSWYANPKPNKCVSY